MSSVWKNNIEITIFGESHGKGLGIVLGNLPAGIKLDMDLIKKDLKKRAPGNDKVSTSRKEADEFTVVSGLLDDTTTGAPLCCMIENTNQHSKDYSILETNMRPGHSDYPAYIKYHGFNDVQGGGHFSGRITAPIVLAGAIAKQIIAKDGVYVAGHIKQIGDVKDDNFDTNIDKQLIEDLNQQMRPTINQEAYPLMEQAIIEAVKDQDSLGGKVECAIVGVKAGLGDPFFDSIESHLASLLFSVPAVKSVAFGNENITELTGSQANDNYYYDGDVVKTKTNNNGGITGGISNGMPIVFTVGIKPTPSISKKQETINVETKKDTTLEIKGRHDPCIVPRAVVVIEAMAALTILDFMR